MEENVFSRINKLTRVQKVNQNFINKKFLCLKFEGPTMSACENNDTVFRESRPVR